jgi:hypothetical protein
VSSSALVALATFPVAVFAIVAVGELAKMSSALWQLVQRKTHLGCKRIVAHC